MNELILEIMRIALNINSKQKNTIFMSFYGHVNSFLISVYKNGWESENKADYEKDLYLDFRCDKSELEDILDYLKVLGGKINANKNINDKTK